ncbi:MAG: hypothetical protein JXM72_07215 [Deltaproteobacteria bacterium]|nr:hypothetical protein [Deltaproteobacteria bacterium]
MRFNDLFVDISFNRNTGKRATTTANNAVKIIDSPIIRGALALSFTVNFTLLYLTSNAFFTSELTFTTVGESNSKVYVLPTSTISGDLEISYHSSLAETGL